VQAAEKASHHLSALYDRAAGKISELLREERQLGHQIEQWKAEAIHSLPRSAARSIVTPLSG